MIKSTSLVYFSPTGTTKKIIEAIATGINSESIIPFDLTNKASQANGFHEFKNEVVIIGVPVYSGRVPKEAVLRMQKLSGNNTPCILVVVYGNRAYDDALLELRNLAIERGFKPIAAAAFIGEHSFSSKQFPIANDRPDIKNLEQDWTLSR
jgi:flavodoxin